MVQPEVYFSRWRLPPSWISKNFCMFLLFDRSSPKLVETLGLRWRRKCIFEKIQNNGRRHLEFRKNGCHFFTIWPIIAKFHRNIASNNQTDGAWEFCRVVHSDFLLTFNQQLSHSIPDYRQLRVVTNYQLPHSIPDYRQQSHRILAFYDRLWRVA